MRGAECNTDHNMLKIKLVVGKQRSFCRPKTGPSVTRYNVVKLRQQSDGRNGGDEARDIFGGLLCESLHGGVCKCVRECVCVCVCVRKTVSACVSASV